VTWEELTAWISCRDCEVEVFGESAQIPFTISYNCCLIDMILIDI
jgi:hypothetical protein